MTADDTILAPTHQCKHCNALWRQCDDGRWNLRSPACGACCDNAPMGEQIVSLVSARAEVERLRAFERGVIEAIPGPRYMDPPDGGDVTPLEQVRRMAAEVERLLSANQDLQGWLHRSGFVPCDIAACNCGGWHARFGLPDRMEELKTLLSDAGHPLTNENGNLPRQALADLIGERDTLRGDLAEASKDSKHD